MSLFRKPKGPSVNTCGAMAGCVLRGSGANNQGLRVRLLEEQLRGHEGPIRGGFVILDAGNNKHSESLRSLVHQVTDAATVLEVIRQLHRGCVSVVNTNILEPE
jgi:hypothetical protein